MLSRLSSYTNLIVIITCLLLVASHVYEIASRQTGRKIQIENGKAIGEIRDQVRMQIAESRRINPPR